MLALLLAGALALGAAGDPDPRAAAVVDTAIARMGGLAALERIERVRFEMVTQWLRTEFDARPFADFPSFEFNSDLRDYTLRGWRNTRRNSFAANARAFTDVISDTVAMRNLGQGWAPLNVAYVDERRELFAVAPDRALLLARRANDLRALPDTTIGALAHARVSATLDGLPATLFIRRGDGFLALVRWRAAQHNDFGLTGWGVMEAEHWYSQWRPMPGGIAYPTQWDVTRVGRPYRRMTLLSVRFDVPATPDSFAISDSLRGAFFATASRPMHDLPLDSARLVEPRLATFGAFGTPAGAVKLGRRWLLLEAGAAPLSVERSARWLARADAGSSVAGAVITMPLTGTTGGSTWLASQRVPLHVGEGSRRFVEAMLRERKDARAAISPVTSGRWLRVDGDSAWVEPIDLPDFPGTLVVWVPALRWVYTGPALLPVQRDRVLAHARARGWTVERFGSQRVLLTPVPAAGVASPNAQR